MIDLSILILNYNTSTLTLECLNSIFKYPPSCDFQVVVVDNASTDGSTRKIRDKYKNVKIISNKKNYGFAKGNNVGIRAVHANSRYCLLLNSDTQVTPNALSSLYDYAVQNQIDISSCKLVDTKGQFQPNGGQLPSFWHLFFWVSGLDDLFRKFLFLPSYQERNIKVFATGKIGWVSGSVMQVKSTVFKQIGLLDEAIFMYGEDVEFCLRAAREHLSLGWTDRAKIIHLGGASHIKAQYSQWLGEFKGIVYIYRKHYGACQALIIKAIINWFIFLRMIAFMVIGKLDYAKTYAKIIFKF